MLSQIEQDYLAKYPMKRLTFDGVNDLYQSRWGARTILDIIEMRKLQDAYDRRPVPVKRMEISWEYGMMNERCIEQNGFGMYSPF